MKRATQQLRSRTLDATALEKANGGRGTCCGASLHCSACGVSSLTTQWNSRSNDCPHCGCPSTMTNRQWNGTEPGGNK